PVTKMNGTSGQRDCAMDNAVNPSNAGRPWSDRIRLGLNWRSSRKKVRSVSTRLKEKSKPLSFKVCSTNCASHVSSSIIKMRSFFLINEFRSPIYGKQLTGTIRVKTRLEKFSPTWRDPE